MLDEHALTRRRLCVALAALPAAAAVPGPAQASEAPTAMQTGTTTSTSSMLARPIGRTGEHLPVIGMGSSNTFDVGVAPDERAPLLDVLRELTAAGGSVVDTSPMYGRSEGVLGDLIEELALRPKLWLATKVWTKGREAGEQQIAASMRELGAARLELLQIHNRLDWQVHLPTLRALRETGKVKYLGITHYRADAHADLERVLSAEKFDFVQFNYSLAEREAEQRLLPFCRDRGVAVLVNRPFADGAMFQRVRDKPLPAIARELGIASWGQFFLKWIVGHPAVTCVIPATSKPKHMLDNCRAGFGPIPDTRQRELMAQAW
ncbi:MAG TPA: aldo/keto reductase [Steroidobacteraceae bacterium]|nr:aldo/keto reductase [Steroidobacteraceae bacterium]